MARGNCIGQNESFLAKKKYMDLIKYFCLAFVTIIGCISCEENETKKNQVTDLTENCTSTLIHESRLNEPSNDEMYTDGLYNHLNMESPILHTVNLKNRIGKLVVYLTVELNDSLVHKQHLLIAGYTDEHVKKWKDGKHEIKLITTLDKIGKNENGIVSASYGLVARRLGSKIVNRGSFSVKLPITSAKRGSTQEKEDFLCLDSKGPVRFYRSDINYGDWNEKKNAYEHNLKIDIFAQFK